MPGPEYHVRPGYDEAGMADLLWRGGLRPGPPSCYRRAFTKATVDLVSLGHLENQRVLHRRPSWTWADATEKEDGLAFRWYRGIFPVLTRVASLDRHLAGVVEGAAPANRRSAIGVQVVGVRGADLQADGVVEGPQGVPG